MSLNDANSSEAINFAPELLSPEENRKKDGTTEIEVRLGSNNVTNCQTDDVASVSGFGRKAADVEATTSKSPKGIFTSFRSKQLQGAKEKREGSVVKESKAEDGTSRSKLEKDVAEMNVKGDNAICGPQGYIHFYPEASGVIINEYVTAEIAKFLNFEDLQSLRQVNRLFSAGATSQFVRRCVFVLASGKIKERETKFLKIAALHLRGLRELKMKLRKKYGFESESDLFNDIVEHFSPTLKTLKFIISSNVIIFFPRASIQLPALTSLSVDALEVDIIQRSGFLKMLYISAPHLTQLFVCHLDSAIFSPILADNGSNTRNWSLVPKLKSLRVRDTMFSEELSTLNEFPQIWKSLNINLEANGLHMDTTFQLLGQLLENNKDSIINLTLDINLHSFENLQTLRFPKTFPRLQILKLKFWDMSGKINFGRDGVNYSKKFPNLTSFSLIWGFSPSLEMLTRIRSAFFPRQVFEGLKYLELELGANYDRYLLKERIFKHWANIMFPNSRNEINLQRV